MAKSTKSEEYVSGPQLAELADEAYSTIDHWSDKGLLVFRYRGRRRLYEPKANLDRCRRIRSLQEQGMNLMTISTMLEGRPT